MSNIDDLFNCFDEQEDNKITSNVIVEIENQNNERLAINKKPIETFCDYKIFLYFLVLLLKNGH